MKKIVIALGLLVAAALGLYLFSPLWRAKELDEPFPPRSSSEKNMGNPTEESEFSDRFDAMNSTERERFNTAVTGMAEVTLEMEEIMPAAATRVLSESALLPRAHEVEGRALLVANGEQKYVRFEDFNTINGPNLHIYLSANLGGDDFIDLGPIRATKGNVNYTIPLGTDTSKYNKVLVWCVPFSVLFSYANLTP